MFSVRTLTLLWIISLPKIQDSTMTCWQVSWHHDNPSTSTPSLRFTKVLHFSSRDPTMTYLDNPSTPHSLRFIKDCETTQARIWPDYYLLLVLSKSTFIDYAACRKQCCSQTSLSVVHVLPPNLIVLTEALFVPSKSARIRYRQSGQERQSFWVPKQRFKSERLWLTMWWWSKKPGKVSYDFCKLQRVSPRFKNIYVRHFAP